MLENFTDETLMPWGKFQGEKMANVPAWYLIWLYEHQKCAGKLEEYIKDNLDVLREEIKQERLKKK
jgi:uncharacterized protein (DUF3820 family)